MEVSVFVTVEIHAERNYLFDLIGGFGNKNFQAVGIIFEASCNKSIVSMQTGAVILGLIDCRYTSLSEGRIAENKFPFSNYKHL